MLNARDYWHNMALTCIVNFYNCYKNLPICFGFQIASWTNISNIEITDNGLYVCNDRKYRADIVFQHAGEKIFLELKNKNPLRHEKIDVYNENCEKLLYINVERIIARSNTLEDLQKGVNAYIRQGGIRAINFQ